MHFNKVEVFVKKDWKNGDVVFSHNWFNDGKDCFDSVIQERDDEGHTLEKESIDFVSQYDGYKGPTEYYLEHFKKEGYRWVEVIPTKYQYDNINSFKMQIDDETFDYLPSMFIRVTGYSNDDFPLYYYSTKVSGISDQNFERTSYEIEFVLDFWATYQIYLHHFMKESTDVTNFLNKMCNRFIFNEQRNDKGELIDSKGFIIDYQQQAYLMRSGKYETQLVVNDDRENFLSLEEWLFINSGKTKVLDYDFWLKNVWLNWLKNPYVGIFSPKVKASGDKSPVFNAEDIGKYQNKYAQKLLEGFYDTDFNSNSKYRYLVCKIGNNTSPQLKDPSKPSGMFTNYSYDVISCNPTSSTSQTTMGTELWTEDEPYSYFKEVNISGFNIDTGAVTISWDNWLIDEKSITMKFVSDIIEDYYITWTDNLQLKSHRKVLMNYVFDKEYSIIDLPTKSYAFDIYGDFVNVSLSINIKFTSSTTGKLVFRVKFDKNYEKIVWPTITAQLDSSITINSFNISQNGTLSFIEDNINGETLMMVPFKKGKKESDYIKALNSKDDGICMGDGSVLGMPINDIPPSVLALAIRRQNDDSDWQTIGDILSVRNVENIACPIDIVDFKLSDLDIPALFTSFDNIPVVVATAPLKDNVYECVGGNKFFNYYFEILTQDYLTNNTEYYDSEGNLRIHGGNTKEVEPFLYGPQFWKWVYFIDGAHSIDLTGEKLDFKKLITKDDWEVRLNVNLNATTNYFLDISDIKNNKYPMSKLGMEFINQDPASFPFTTEAYNNWAQGNQLTQETAKNAKDITNEYVKKRGIVDATIGALEAGAQAASHSAGRGLFGLKGAAAGAVAGGAVALAHAAGAVAGMELTVAENNKQFENKWRGELGNFYTSPSQLNPSGFTSGSLIYSQIKEANQNSYELFRTFSAPDYILESVWQDIAMNGYPFLSQCTYNEYNNRLRFNIVNCKLIDKQHKFIDELKRKMFKLNPIFASDNYILMFINKCLEGFRVFKCPIDYDNMEQIISENIELIREWVQPYFAPKKTVVIETDLQSSDYQTLEWNWDDEYDKNGNILSKKVSSEAKEIDVSFEKLGITSLSELQTKFDSIQLGNKNSFGLILLKDGENYDYIVSANTVEYGPTGIKPYEIESNISSIPNADKLKYSVYAEKDGKQYKPLEYKVGWNVVISQNGENVHFKLTPYSKWIFQDGLDLTDATIKNWIKEYTKDVTFKSGDSANKTFVDKEDIIARRSSSDPGKWYGYYENPKWDGTTNSYHGINPQNEDMKKWFGNLWLYKGEVITKKYEDLGIKNVHNRETFLEKISKIEVDLSKYRLFYQVYSSEDKWEKTVTPNNVVINKSDLPVSGTKSLLFNLMGINDNNSQVNIDVNSQEEWKKLYMEVLDGAGAQHIRQGTGAMNFTLKIEITLNDYNFVITPYYINNCYIKAQHFGSWLEGCYIAPKNNKHEIRWNIGVNNFKMQFNGQDVTSKWFMNNNLNNLVFVRKDKKNPSSILKNKKEGN